MLSSYKGEPGMIKFFHELTEPEFKKDIAGMCDVVEIQGQDRRIR